MVPLINQRTCLQNLRVSASAWLVWTQKVRWRLDSARPQNPISETDVKAVEKLVCISIQGRVTETLWWLDKGDGRDKQAPPPLCPTLRFPHTPLNRLQTPPPPELQFIAFPVCPQTHIFMIGTTSSRRWFPETEPAGLETEPLCAAPVGGSGRLVSP